VACVVLGGTSLFGGEGGMGRTLIGVLTFRVLEVGLQRIAWIDEDARILLTGVVLLAALVITGGLKAYAFFAAANAGAGAAVRLPTVAVPLSYDGIDAAARSVADTVKSAKGTIDGWLTWSDLGSSLRALAYVWIASRFAFLASPGWVYLGAWWLCGGSRARGAPRRSGAAAIASWQPWRRRAGVWPRRHVGGVRAGLVGAADSVAAAQPRCSRASSCAAFAAAAPHTRRPRPRCRRRCAAVLAAFVVTPAYLLNRKAVDGVVSSVVVPQARTASTALRTVQDQVAAQARDNHLVFTIVGVGLAFGTIYAMWDHVTITTWCSRECDTDTVPPCRRTPRARTDHRVASVSTTASTLLASPCVAQSSRTWWRRRSWCTPSRRSIRRHPRTRKSAGPWPSSRRRRVATTRRLLASLARSASARASSPAAMRVVTPCASVDALKAG